MGNQLSEEQRLERAHRTGILTLSSCGLQKLPPRLDEELKHQQSTLVKLLKSLDLSGNKFTEIPSEFKRLTALKNLIFRSNRLVVFATELGDQLFPNWQKLQTLDLRNNQLRSIPTTPSWSKLLNLQTLQLNNNQLETLPEELAFLPALVTLEADSNRLTRIPAQLPPSLQLLSLNRNAISEVPSSMRTLRKLITLRLEYNQIRDFPSVIFTETEIKAIHIDKNPIGSKILEIDGYKEYEKRRKERVDQLLKT